MLPTNSQTACVILVTCIYVVYIAQEVNVMKILLLGINCYICVIGKKKHSSIYIKLSENKGRDWVCECV